MLLPAGLRPWPGCQQHGWVGVGEGSQPVPCPGLPPAPHPREPYLVSDTEEPE